MRRTSLSIDYSPSAQARHARVNLIAAGYLATLRAEHERAANAAAYVLAGFCGVTAVFLFLLAL